jgi:hypothetical protein
VPVTEAANVTTAPAATNVNINDAALRNLDTIFDMASSLLFR